MTTTKDSLLHKFSSDSLTDEEKLAFKHYYDTDEAFAQKAFDLSVIEASYHTTLDKIATKHHEKQPIKHKSLKTWLSPAITVAASVVIVVCVLFNNQNTDSSADAPTIISQTDTVYLPQEEYLNLPNDIAPVLYANNLDMDKLVEQKDMLMRSCNIISCLPLNNTHVMLGKSLDFELTHFKAGTYQLQILAFYEHITSCDTIYSSDVRITDNHKTAYTWTPKSVGVYYWMIYLNNSELYLVRRLEVIE